MTVHGTGTSGPANPDTEELSPQSSEDAINKLEDQISAPNVASENDAVKKEAAPDADEAKNASSVPQHHRTSCFFEWRLLPQHKISVIHDDPNVQAGQSSSSLSSSQSNNLIKFKCDLCLEEVEGGIGGLKLHQIGLHINPYYLSASDRILAQISSYAVQTDKTEGPWVPNWDTFKVCNLKISVAKFLHLLNIKLVSLQNEFLNSTGTLSINEITKHDS